MKGCDVVTVHEGVVQAIKGPIAYFGYQHELKNHSFAVDAKMFVATLKKFKNDFKVIHNKDTDRIVFFDAQQEIDFIRQPAEILLSTSRLIWEPLDEFANSWNIAQKFVATDFPGVKIEHNYIEVLSDNSIVRIQTPTRGLAGIFASVKLPAGISKVSQHNNRLWFYATNFDHIVVNHLDINFPNTDTYFNQWPDDFEEIPNILKQRFVETDKTVFDAEGVKFIQEEKATAVIENIIGRGHYSGKLFSNILSYGDRYSFQDRFVAFEAPHIKGVVARAD